LRASELKNGTVFDASGRTVIVTGVQMQTASSRSGNTLYKVRGRDLITRQKFEASFKGDETLAAVACERRAVQLIYRDADGCTFMDGETFEQHTLDNESLEEQMPYLVDGLDGLYALVIDVASMGSTPWSSTIACWRCNCRPLSNSISSTPRQR